jgi:enoyl-CoA hydratase/carnithine racemase
MRNLAKPTLAAVHGYCLAGGFELAIECDIRFAAESAVFGLPDTPLGLSPTSGMTWLLPRTVGRGWAMHLALSGERIDARQAERIGLVTRVVPDEQLLESALDLAQRLAASPPLGLQHTRQGIDFASEHDFEAALATEVEAEVACFDAPAFQANLRAFRDRRRAPRT